MSETGIGVRATAPEIVEKIVLSCLATRFTTSFNLAAILNPACASKSWMASSNISRSSSI